MDNNKVTEILQALKSHPYLKNKLQEGDKVKINVESMRWQKDSYTPEFWEWLENNKDTIFTLVTHNKYGVLWGFKEDSRWLLYADYLIKIN